MEIQSVEPSSENSTGIFEERVGGLIAGSLSGINLWWGWRYHLGYQGLNLDCKASALSVI